MSARTEGFRVEELLDKKQGTRFVGFVPNEDGARKGEKTPDVRPGVGERTASRGLECGKG